MASPFSSLAALPSVDRLLQRRKSEALIAGHGRPAVTDAIRAVLAEMRSEPQPSPDGDAILNRVAQRLEDEARASLRPVFNLTGTVLHTNLGRAQLAEEAIEAMAAAGRNPVNLEYDLAAGRRGERDGHVERLLCRLTGAEAATVVNNNAAAVLLVLNTLAARKEVPTSRGELIEIGDSFRIPDVMVRAGGRLREVGATNRTHLGDYEAAIGPETALILQVHRSNFQLLGFTADVETADLVALARRHGVPVMEDLGSGAPLDLTSLRLRREPLAADAIRAGVDLVTFSGDKLLGGPQAGILVGRRDLLGRLRRNPLARAVRIDKLCLAALEATLRLCREPERAMAEIPTLRMLGLPAAAIGARAEALQGSLRSAETEAACTVEEGTSEVGGGALPLQSVPTRVLAIRPLRGSAMELEARLRRGRPPVLVRIKEDRVLLDLRTVEPGEDGALLQALLQALRPARTGGAS